MDKTISDLFTVQYGLGEYEDKGGLKSGNTPIISSKGTDNGCYGFFDVPVAYKAPIITVPRTGTIGHAFVQLEDCTPNSDCLVLVPRKPMDLIDLFEVALQIRGNKWKYQYGRKITPGRLNKQVVSVGRSKIDYEKTVSEMKPKKIPIVNLGPSYQTLNIEDIFTVVYGQTIYESKKELPIGTTPLISSKGEDNGYYGFYDIPALYKAPFITVPRTGTIAKAFVQEVDCAVDSNCLILTPRDTMEIEALYVIAEQIRASKWRYKYGRQVTPDRINKQKVILPSINK